MTGTPQGQFDDGYAEQPAEPSAARPPLPGPVDETSGPVTIVPGPAAQDSPGWSPGAGAPVPARQQADRPATYSGTTPSSTITGFLSDVRRNGRWEVPPVLTVVQGMADVTLDLREAVVTSPVVEIRFYGGMSDLKVIVPPGVDVEWGDGISLLSDEDSDPPGRQDPGMWRLRVTHYGLMSDVKVRTLELGAEPTKKWWKRKA